MTEQQANARSRTSSPTAVAFLRLRRAGIRADRAVWLAAWGYTVVSVVDLNEYELIPVGGK